MDDVQYLKDIYIERLTKLLDLLESNGLQPFLLCGTLLAFIREGQPFTYDLKDIDISLPKEDYWAFRKIIDSSPDFKYYRIWRNEIAVYYKDKKIDILFLETKPEENKAYIYSYKQNSFTGKYDTEWRVVFKSSDFYPLKRVKYPFLNREVYIPFNSENVLATHYNKDWKTPNPNWSNDCLTNVDIEHRQIAFILPQDTSEDEKNQCLDSIINLYPENWYRIYNNIEDAKEPFLIILNKSYIFKKELDLNALIQSLLDKEEIGAVTYGNNTENTVLSFASRTQTKKEYVYGDLNTEFILAKKEYLDNQAKYKTILVNGAI